jgi:hypothetical protein
MDDQRTNRKGGSVTTARYRFRFSLKWLFIAVTAFSLWLGWSFSQLRQRDAVEAFITAQGGTVTRGALMVQPYRPWKRMSLSWRLLGAKPVQIIDARGVTDEGDREQIRASFPEAEIRYGS